MWLYDEGAAELRKKFAFVLKIAVHSTPSAMGKDCWTEITNEPVTHPISERQPARIRVYYFLKSSQRDEEIDISQLELPKPRSDDRMAIVKGPRSVLVVKGKKGREGKRKAFGPDGGKPFELTEEDVVCTISESYGSRQ